MPRFRTLAATAALLAATSMATAGGDVWSFDVSTTGNDVFWTSPTSVDPSAPRYRGDTFISLVEVTVDLFGNPITVDVTDQLTPEQQMNSVTVDGPLPIVLFNEMIVVPGPPDPPGVEATLFIELDAAGFGQLAATNITLGTVQVPPFGALQILEIRVAGDVTIDVIEVIGDVDGDGVVGTNDLLTLLANWGDCPQPCPSDLNGDGVVNLVDLLELIANWTLP